MTGRFEVSLLGGALERQYRKPRASAAEAIDRLPWATLDGDALSPELRTRAATFWARAALQEHRTAAACAATAEALVNAQAPLDLSAAAAGFVLDELAHVELCARVAAALCDGDLPALDPAGPLAPPDPRLAPLARVAELAVRVFCVGEAFSIRMQRATARAERHPLLRALISRLAKDEAAHGRFGWLVLDWADEALDPALRRHLGGVAARAIHGLESALEAGGADDAPRFGWLPPSSYRAQARRALEDDVRAPLQARGLLAAS